MQVRIHYTDRDYLRFLWVDGDGRLAVYRMTSISFGATCFPFLLAVIIRYLLKYVATTTVAKQLIGRLYADDLIVTAKATAELSRTHDDSVALFDQCSMPLHKWRSSDAQLDQAWTDGQPPEHTKVLGTSWWPAPDCLQPCLPKTDVEQVTRRTLLRQTGMIFDPLGLFGPFTVQLKFLIRQALLLSDSWDLPVSDQIAAGFKKLVGQFDQLADLRIPRSVLTNASDCTLALFCGASHQGVGAAVYVIYWIGSVRSNLLVSRSKLSTQRTTPELELEAALLGIRLLVDVAKIMSIRRWRMYTDSTTDGFRATPIG